jgi:hypothetical protein
VDTQSPESAAASAPAALADLIAARLVSHEMIGDPARLGSEAAALRVLCGLIAGPVWRIEPFHYAFRAGPGDFGGDFGGDLGGALEAEPAEARAAVLEAALQGALGADAVWVSATDLAEEDAGPLEQPLVVLRAQAEALADALAVAAPGLQAVVNARVAVETARLTADSIAQAGPGGVLAARLDAIEARQAEIGAALAAQAEATAALSLLGATLETVLRRLDAQADVLHAHIAREDMVAGRLAELAALAGAPSAFQETVGVTLAEVLARLDAQAEAAPARVPQFS